MNKISVIFFVLCFTSITSLLAADNQNMESALFAAVKNGDASRVKALLEGGANVNATESVGLTPLHYAAGFNNVTVAELLIAYGSNIDATDWNGETPAHWAAIEHHKSMVRFLIAKGADANAKDNFGRTPSIALATSTKVILFEGVEIPLTNGEKLQLNSLNRAEIRQLQESLTVCGYDAGPADGMVGPNTRSAMTALMKSGNKGTGIPMKNGRVGSLSDCKVRTVTKTSRR